MPDRYARRLKSRPVPLLIAAVLTLASGHAAAEEVFWVGYQYGAPGAADGWWRTSASWFHADNWLNYTVPGENDTAIFGGTDDTVYPRDIYFGDYTVSADPPGINDPIPVPGGDAAVKDLVIRGTSLDFFFKSQDGNSQGSLAVAGKLSIIADGVQPPALTIHGSGLTAGSIMLMGEADKRAELTIAEGILTSSGLVDVGVLGGTGRLTVTGDGLLKAGYTRVGENAGSDGVLTIDGPSARAEIAGGQIGATGTGRLEIVNGGSLLSTNHLNVANYGASAVGHVVVSGASSSLTANSGVGLGVSGQGYLTAQQGASVLVSGGISAGMAGGAGVIESTSGATIRVADGPVVLGQDPGTSGTAYVNNSGSLIATEVLIGYGGSGALKIEGAGTVASERAVIGAFGSSDGTVTVEDAGSRWDVAGTLEIAGDNGQDGGSGRLTIRDGALMTVGLSVNTWSQATIDVHDGGRMLIGSGDATAVPAGALEVAAGGTLSGTGTIIGDVLNSGGTIDPGHSPGNLSIDGNLALGADGILRLQIGGDTSGLFDTIHVTGQASLDGRLILEFIDGYKPTGGEVFNLIVALGGLAGDFRDVEVVNFDASDVDVDASGGIFSLSIRPAAVPEPASLVLLGLGTVAIAVATRRRTR